MFKKITFLIFLVVLILATVILHVESKNFKIKGHSVDQCPDPTVATTLLCQQDLKESGKFLQVLSETVDCPSSGVNKFLITCIKVTNKLGEDGGDAEIVTGGLGYTSVEIIMKSQRSKGLEYHIEVYVNPDVSTDDPATTTL